MMVIRFLSGGGSLSQKFEVIYGPAKHCFAGPNFYKWSTYFMSVNFASYLKNSVGTAWFWFDDVGSGIDHNIFSA